MKNRLSIFIIVALGVICYSYSLGGKFVWDDTYFVVGNTSIRSLRNAPSFFTDPSTLARGKLAVENYRPLVTLSYALDYAVWGMNTFGYHLVNTIFHVLNGVLVFLLLRRFARDEAACFAALLFTAHPVQTEAVSWISGRSNVLFAFFYLASLISYIKFSARKDGVSRYIQEFGKFRLIFDYTNLHYVFSILLFCLALLSKEAAVTLPLVVVAYDAILRREGLGARIRRWLPYFLISAGYLLLRYSMLNKLSQRPYWGGSIFNALLNMPKIVAEYIRLLFWPFDLCVDRQAFLANSVADIGFLCGVFALAALLAIFIAGLRREKGAAFFSAWFIITLAPFLNIIPINIFVAERFLYLPSIGVFFLFSALLFRLAGKVSRIFFSAVILLLVPLAVLTANRNLQWRDSYTLFENDVKSQPWNARLRNSLAVEYLMNDEAGKAEAEFREAMTLDGNYIYNYINLSKFYFREGRIADAEEVARKGLEIHGDDADLLNTMAVIKIGKGDREGAEAMLRSAIAKDPRFFDAYLNLGRLLEEKSSRESAMRFYAHSMDSFNTGYEKCMLRLRVAELYEMEGDAAPAREIYRSIIKEYPEEKALCEIARERLGELGGHSPEVGVPKRQIGLDK